MNLSYTGNSAYCFTNSLHMSLNQAGMKDLPSVGDLECFTGMPFGAMFLNIKPEPMFFPGPAGLDPDKGLDAALETLGWACEVWRGDNANESLEQLHHALRYGPVLLGPLDMGYLTYDPNHSFKKGSDHFVVVLKMEDGFVHLHDPQYYPFVMLPTVDLMGAWQANQIGYATSAYTLRWGFAEQRKLKREEMIRNALEFVKTTLKTPQSEIFIGGAKAFTHSASLLRQQPSEIFKGTLIHFALPLGARRCSDASVFLRNAGALEAAKLMLQKSQHYGQAYYHATQQQWEQVVDKFEQLAEIEEELSAKLRQSW